MDVPEFVVALDRTEIAAGIATRLVIEYRNPDRLGRTKGNRDRSTRRVTVPGVDMTALARGAERRPAASAGSCDRRVGVRRRHTRQQAWERQI